MNSKHLATLLGLTSVIALNPVLPVKAEPVIYIETGGKDSLHFDPNVLAVLESIGLSLASVENTDTPAQGYDYAFDILPPSYDPNIRGTDWVFSYDGETDNYEAISGTTELTGSVFFNVDQTKLNLPPVFEIGDFSAFFEVNTDPNIPEPYFVFVRDTANTGLPVFSTVAPGLPNVDLVNNTWILEPLGILLTKEFSDYLIAAGATQSVEGLQVAVARGDRTFIPFATSVPEPTNLVGIFSIAGLGLIMKLKKSV
ncbi:MULTISPECIES: hypothetical protein [Microcystis]|jgi:hypothetical protein|uniref:PEP-CTERM protein-sorting domain-containing protein n=1 Tax=Microcystis panniformis FACHB-1757 TaxID=1638788 RepID=A0A0K1S7K2_9CHRO|nr:MULTISPECIES: hypothetical protein [Microcystis]MCE2661570.1 PEP-CTERM sorting domain-containing protein [Microcystis sp. 53602_E8]MDJ0527779.1 PEP-CTERM sorting domain-containing protein [Microcystis sp. M53600_WE12]NCR79190.1 PEP-CTERM sorting domain-containing protein [Microcystis aeruginosa K13-10]NCR83750.1 PEP-CTERM sorting domain-containing protein [Microcystis aeruginosa K13-05]AKV70013.1 hypothetical protein VL20_5160 [Microcystis panniformis FACHB-1757]